MTEPVTDEENPGVVPVGSFFADRKVTHKVRSCEAI